MSPVSANESLQQKLTGYAQIELEASPAEVGQHQDKKYKDEDCQVVIEQVFDFCQVHGSQSLILLQSSLHGQKLLLVLLVRYVIGSQTMTSLIFLFLSLSVLDVVRTSIHEEGRLRLS